MRKRILALSACAVMLLLSGCEKKGPLTEADELKHPAIKQGRAYLEIKDYKKAKESFQQAIVSNPYMAIPYLDLAIISHNQDNDYISAIFYYNKYLSLRPKSQAAAEVQQKKQDAINKLNELFLQQNGAKQAIQNAKVLQQHYQRAQQELASQKKQVDSLKRQLADLQIKLAKQSVSDRPLSRAEPTISTAPETTSTTTPSAPQSSLEASGTIYHVVEGDNLYRISKKVYGDSSRWKDIYEMNKDHMKSEGDLKVGQSLLIPQ